MLSATDAIQPAWNHARRMTLGPRKWGLAFKITALAFFARVGGCNGHFGNINGAHAHTLPAPLHAALAGMYVLLAMVFLVLALAFFYLSSRLQFVLFDSVLRNDTELSPIWRRYGRATWYWIGLKLLFFAAALICVSPLAVPVLLQFVHVLRAGHAHANPGAVFAAILSMIGALFLAVLVIGVGYTLLMDFGLPSMALEGTPLGETVARIGRLLRAEPGQMLLYLVMKFVLGIAASVICALATMAVAFAALIPLGAVGLATWAGLRHAALTGYVTLLWLLIVLGLLLAPVLIVAVIGLFGYAQVFFQAYALYFLGGRYPLLGEYLERSMPMGAMYGYPPMDTGLPPPLG